MVLGVREDDGALRSPVKTSRGATQDGGEEDEPLVAEAVVGVLRRGGEASGQYFAPSAGRIARNDVQRAAEYGAHPRAPSSRVQRTPILLTTTGARTHPVGQSRISNGVWKSM